VIAWPKRAFPIVLVDASLSYWYLTGAPKVGKVTNEAKECCDLTGTIVCDTI
jgi:hypothetical protein